MVRPADDSTPRERQARHGAWAVTIAAAALLVFTWPFLRTPPLGIGRTYAHLLVAWVLVIAALALLARAIGRGGSARGDGG